MSIFNIFKRKINKNATNQPDFIRDFYPTSSSFVGTDSTAFSCIDRVASAFAGLNYGIYSTKTRQKIKEHRIYELLKEPNLDDRHFNFFYQSAIDYFNGGCFWLKETMGKDIISIFRINPSEVRIKRNTETNQREFLYNGNVYTSKQILYIPSRHDYSTLTGGTSIFSASSNTFETTKALEAYTQSAFKNGIGGRRVVMDVSGAFPDLTPEQAIELKTQFQNEYGGVANTGRPLLKRKGIEYTELGAQVDNRASELSETRKFQEKEIAKIFGVPVELLSGLDSKADLENLFVLFNEFALRPMATQFQEAISSLLDESEFYFEFDYNGIMKVSLNQRIDAYVKQINNGLLSPNEARARENLEPIEAGDTHFTPVNLMPLNDETVEAYMAKQKKEIGLTEQSDQHFGGGDDKQ